MMRDQPARVSGQLGLRRGEVASLPLRDGEQLVKAGALLTYVCIMFSIVRHTAHNTTLGAAARDEDRPDMFTVARTASDANGSADGPVKRQPSARTEISRSAAFSTKVLIALLN